MADDEFLSDDDYVAPPMKIVSTHEVCPVGTMARIRELEAALLQYGYHDVTCHYLRETLMCTCGFESLRAALAPKEPT